MGRAVALLAASAAVVVVGVFLYLSACADGGTTGAGDGCTDWGIDGGALALAAVLGLMGAALGWWRLLGVLGTLLVAAGAPFHSSSAGLYAISTGLLLLVAAWAAHRGVADTEAQRADVGH